jgi:protein TonB
MSRPAEVPKFYVPQARRSAGRWIVVSVVLHGLLLRLIVGVETGILAEIFGTGGGEGPAGGGGGGGAERVTYMDLPAYVSTALAAPRQSPQNEIRFNAEQPSVRQIPLPELKVSIRRPNAMMEAVTALGSDRGIGGGPGRGPGSGGGQGAGLGTGTGSHVGPGTGGNQAYVYAPEPRSITYPVVSVPDALRGQSLTVHFWVDARGRVTRIEVDPPISDRAYRDALNETLLGWTFYPARTASGAPVPGEMEIVHKP